jgi:D-alanyl-D-alanine-carboxypeptidase/D-alanyl-D-alanine-endopeptidase
MWWWTLGIGVAGELPADVVARMEARLARRDDTAAVVGLQTPDGVTLTVWGERTPGVPADVGDAFEIGSITKTFTALLLADAVVRGEVGLDAPVRTLGVGALGRRGRYTLEQLSAHHAGLSRLPCNLAPADPADPYADYGRAQLAAAVQRCPLEGEPEQTFSYSNYGVGLLGELLAVRAQTTWSDLLGDRVLEPLGLARVGLGVTPLVDGSSGGQPAPHWTFGALAGAGALQADAASLLRWGALHAGLEDSPLRAAMELAITPRRDIAPGQGIGLGWFRIDRPDLPPIVWHNGGTGGFRSFVGFAGDRVAVVLVAGQVEVDDVGLHLLAPDRPLLPLTSREVLADDVLAAYTGRWQLQPGFILTITAQDGHLVVEATGQPAFPVWPDGADRFRWEVVEAALVFQRGPDGAVIGATLEQSGSHPLTRVE